MAWRRRFLCTLKHKQPLQWPTHFSVHKLPLKMLLECYISYNLSENKLTLRTVFHGNQFSHSREMRWQTKISKMLFSFSVHLIIHVLIMYLKKSKITRIVRLQIFMYILAGIRHYVQFWLPCTFYDNFTHRVTHFLVVGLYNIMFRAVY